MSLLDLLILLIIAGICGSIAQALVGFSRGGCFLSIAVGFIGALLGSWLAKKFGFPEFFVINIGGTSFPVIWSIIGAVIFVGMLSLLTPRRTI
ncbi:MAG TPA: GlsB/YeaQ/YmgE family stress response membrane protein [Ignavibacteriaceae bacterium]|nr:GlsB/YeaQ/YmgE family stress response membrane protein [Ignavibacteriaceae bacterium]